MSLLPTQTRAEFDEEEALFYRGMLRKLTELAMDMAQSLHDQALTPLEPGTPKPDPTIAFERASRTIRRCILLARKLAERPPTPPPALDRTEARKRIIRTVEDAIQRRYFGEDRQIEALEAELRERIDRSDFEEDLATRPLDDLIADLARDLHCGFLATDRKWGWKRRTPEDIDALKTCAASPPPAPPPAPPRTTPSQGPPR